jgi:hypothetical protein
MYTDYVVTWYSTTVHPIIVDKFIKAQDKLYDINACMADQILRLTDK